MRLVVCISGGGTTLQNLIDRIADGRLVAKIVAVIASNPDAFGIQRARRAGIPVQIVERAGGGHSERLFATIREYDPDFVCLAGWLNLIRIPADYAQRVLNVHPSLLPAFGGKGMYGHRVHEAVLAYGAKVSGCTVHFADDTYDTGPILVQRAVPVHDSDTPEQLAKRVFAAECEAYPEAIQKLAEKKWHVIGRRVVFAEPKPE